MEVKKRFSIEEFKNLCNSSKRKKPRHIERQIQEQCVAWFRLAYPQLICFAVPNGGSRNKIEAANIKREGALAGVSDLVIVAHKAILFVEMKDRKGHQQDTQKQFQCNIERLGHQYIICRSLKDFQMAVERWLKEIYAKQKINSE